MHSPKFSIVVACYNQRDFVKAAVESAISQPHPSKEVIVVDDASSDGTPEVLDEFAASVRLVKFAKNQGALAARNHGASLASGEYLVFLDGDDAFMPWTLEVYERLIAALSPKIVIGERYYFRGETPDMAAEKTPARIDFVDYACWFEKDRKVEFGASNLVVERNTFWEVGGWTLGIFHFDVTDLMLKLGTSGRTLVILAPATVCYRIHTANITNSVAGMLQCAHLALKKEKAGEYPGGRKEVLARAMCLGGPILFWIAKGLRTGRYSEVLKLAASGWFMILGAIVRRVLALGGRRHPVQSMELSHD